jgi:hypothetical protein
MPSPAWQRGSESHEASGHRRQRDLAAAAPRFRVSGPAANEYGEAVRRTADEITARLGGRTPERIEAA